MIPALWLRPGNSYTTNNFLGFLENTLDRLGSKEIGLLRCDSGFFGQEIFHYLEHRTPKALNYIIAARFNQRVKPSDVDCIG